MEKQVKDLKVGDVLSPTNGKIIRISPEDHPMYGKNKMRVTLSYPNRSEGYDVKTSVWGKYTTVKIIDQPVEG